MMSKEKSLKNLIVSQSQIQPKKSDAVQKKHRPSDSYCTSQTSKHTTIIDPFTVMI